MPVFARVILGLLTGASLLWCVLGLVSSFIAAFQNHLLWIPLSAAASGLIFWALCKASDNVKG